MAEVGFHFSRAYIVNGANFNLTWVLLWTQTGESDSLRRGLLEGLFSAAHRFRINNINIWNSLNTNLCMYSCLSIITSMELFFSRFIRSLKKCLCIYLWMYIQIYCLVFHWCMFEQNIWTIYLYTRLYIFMVILSLKLQNINMSITWVFIYFDADSDPQCACEHVWALGWKAA